MEDHQVLNLPQAPQWGIFLGQFGRISVYATLLACTVALLLSLMPSDRNGRFRFFAALLVPTLIVGFKSGEWVRAFECWAASLALGFVPDTRIEFVRRNALYLACLGFVLVFITLAVLFITNQFEFEYIFNHSSKDNPLSYKIASVWTAQQGSFLLWAVYSGLFGWVTLSRSGPYERWYTAAYATFLGVLAGILAYETPFGTIPALMQNGHLLIPPEGGGMVPGLQNYWVVIHPPIIFLGFGSLTVPFAYGIAAMLSGNSVDWIKLCRAPVLFGVSVLGLGISLGGLWAYETQGWGGFWGWDPVENVSLVPWLFLVALAHGVIVQNVRKTWVSANLFMSGLPFISFVYGTFLTRSGLLDKVSMHSFASMDRNALVVLRTFLIALAIFYAVLYAVKGRPKSLETSKSEKSEPGANRASFYQVGMLSLCLMSFVIALGMSWPAITAMRGGLGKMVEPYVYHKAVFWFFAVIMVVMAVGPFVSWKRDKLKNIFGRFVTMASIAIAIVGVFLILAKNPNWGVGLQPGATVDGFWQGSAIPLTIAVSVLLFLCVFVATTNLWRAIELAKRSKLGVGPFIAHLGIAILLGGLIISKSLERTELVFVREGDPASALGYKIAFKDFDPDRYYDRSNVVKFDVLDPDGRQHVIEPNLYYIPNGGVEETAQSWPFIERSLSHDMYYFLKTPEVEIFPRPINITPGKTISKNKFVIKYLELTHTGQLGSPGVKFGAKLEVTYAWDERNPAETFSCTPTLTMVSPGHMQPELVSAGPNIKAVITSMNANDKSVDVQLFIVPPIYPIQIFYKPLTCLVWIGTGVFTLGGFIAAFYRRVVRKSPEGDFVANSAKIDSKN